MDTRIELSNVTKDQKKSPIKTAKEVENVKTRGNHVVEGARGLYLRVSKNMTKSWALRYRRNGKLHELGLGSFPGVSLAQARELSGAHRTALRNGQDPKQEKEAAIARNKSDVQDVEKYQAMTFAKCAEEFLPGKIAEFKNAKHAAQWGNTLKQYAYPVIGDLPVDAVKLDHILKILSPIWPTITETANRLRGRMEKVLGYAKVRGYRKGDNPAAWRDNLELALSSPTKIRKKENWPALPYSQIHAFLADLRKEKGLGARAIELAILTAARSGEVRCASWGEFDLDAKVWTVPAERMKMRREHRVPLTATVIKLLGAQPRIEGTDLVFPSTKNTPLSDMTLSAVIIRMNAQRTIDGLPKWIDPKRKRDIVPHGFRATFKTWCSETTDYPLDAVEFAMAHVNKDRVAGAYNRGDLLEKRRLLMAEWEKFCNRPEQAPAKVVPMRGRKSKTAA